MVSDLRHCTALELLSSLPDGGLDLLWTDPPYGKKYRAGTKRTNSRKAARQTAATFGEDVLQTDWLTEAYRTLKNDSAMYLCTQWDVMSDWMPAIKSAGFAVEMCIVWDKLHWGGGRLEIYGCQTEFILYCTKGKPVLFPAGKGREGNVWRKTKLDSINNEGNYDNPTQKPESIIMRALLYSTRPGDLVCDPFCGSGSTGAAARRMSRRYLLCDRDERQYQIAKARLENPFQVHFMETL